MPISIIPLFFEDHYNMSSSRFRTLAPSRAGHRAAVFIASLVALLALVMGSIGIRGEGSGFIEARQFGDFTYLPGDSAMTLTGYGGAGGAVVVPDTIEGLPVTSLAPGAFASSAVTRVTLPESVVELGNGVFSNCAELESVTLGGSVTSLPDWAFSNCPRLADIRIPSGVTNIGAYAVSGCAGLTTIRIPAAVQNIGEGAFSSSPALVRIDVDAANTWFRSVSGVLFDSDQSTLLQYPSGQRGAYSIPDGIRKIRRGAFANAPALTRLAIPRSVTEIEDPWLLAAGDPLSEVIVDPLNPVYSSVDGVLLAQSGSVLLRFPPGKSGAYTVPATVARISESAFASCQRLTSVEMPPTVTHVGRLAFLNCASLSRVRLPELLTVLEESTFSGCGSLVEADLPDSVTSIRHSAFSGCARLGQVRIPKGTLAIAGFAFAGCSGLTNLVIPDSLRELGHAALAGCDGLRSLNLGRVTMLGDQAFTSCATLTQVILPQGVTRIGYGTFENCLALTNVVIPSTVTEIGHAAFRGCAALPRVLIPSSVTQITTFAFENCQSMRSIEVDPGNRAYSSLDGVLFNKDRTVLLQYPIARTGPYAIPDTVATLNNGAFYLAESLTEVDIPGSVGEIWPDCFLKCSSLTKVRINPGLKTIGLAAFALCPSLGNVVIPSTVTRLGDSAFAHCAGLAGVYFQGSPPGSDLPVFGGSDLVTVFHRLASEGWGPIFSGRPTAVWWPQPEYAPWAEARGLPRLYPEASGPDDDADGDGANNRAESLTGTDPTDAASSLGFDLSSQPESLAQADMELTPATHHALYFRSVPGTRYLVESAADVTGPWRVELVRTATATQTRALVKKPAGHAFYRVTVFAP